MPGVPTKPRNPRIYHRGGAPDFWLAMEGPRRTFASDAGDVADLTGRYAAAIRSPECQWVNSPVGPALSPTTIGNARISGYLQPVRSWTATALVLMAPTANPGVNRVLSQQAGGYLGLVINAGQVTALSSLDSIVYPAGSPDFGPSILDGLLHHVAAVRDLAAGQLRLYLDGKATKSFAISSTDPYGMEGVDFYLSSYVGNQSECFDGIVPDCRFYSRALSDPEMAREAADPFWRLRRPRGPARVSGFQGTPAPAAGLLSGRTASTIRNTIANPAASDELVAAVQSGTATLSGKTALAIRFAMANAVAADELIAAVNGSAAPLSGSTMSAIRFAMAFSPAADELIAAVNAIGAH